MALIGACTPSGQPIGSLPPIVLLPPVSAVAADSVGTNVSWEIPTIPYGFSPKCSPRSGSYFEVGTHLVECEWDIMEWDPHTPEDVIVVTGSFTVTVHPDPFG